MDAFNARDFARMNSLLGDEMSFIDSTARKIEGKDDVLALVYWLVNADPSFRQEPEDCSLHGDKVLMRGHIVSTQTGRSGRALWEINVRNDCITRFQSYRAEGAIPLVKLFESAGERDQFKLQRTG